MTPEQVENGIGETQTVETDALHRQRDWLLGTLSSIGDAVITVDCDNFISYLNPVAEDLTEWSLQEAIAQPIDKVFHIISEEWRQPVESPARHARRVGLAVKLAAPCLLITKSGMERPIDDSAAPIRDGEGNITGVVIIFRDITQRRETELALAKALNFADDIIATLREPFIVLDSELRVKTANRSFYANFHVSEDETENRFVYDLGNGQWDIPGLRTLLDNVLSCKKSVDDYEVEHCFPALGLKTMILNARPFPPDCEHPELILLAVEDVSAVRERADDLALANRHKDEFLATLAHELRNPLAPIRNAVRCLGMDELQSADMKAAGEIIDRQVSVMVRLVDDLIDVSRISRNELDMRKERIELALVLERAMESSVPLIEQRGHELIVELPGEPLYLEADPVRLAQVFLNLLNNAAKYTEPGGHIWLTVSKGEDDAIITVRDDGTGIPGDMLHRVFDMFTQLKGSMERAEGGLGIGLTLVRRLLEMHGGTIEARSQGLGRGSEFAVRLPLAAARPDEPSAVAEETSPLPPSERRILVVDDNVDSAATLGMFLKFKGNSILTANDGLQALELAETFRPDVILLDIGLPKLNGYDVARRIRLESWGGKLTLVAMTGWGQEEDKRAAREAGFDFHLVKPIDFDALDAILKGT